MVKPAQTLETQIIEIPTIQVQVGSVGINLNRTQMRVLEFILAGESNKEIANRINLSEQGVKYHVGILLKMFNVVNRIDLRIKIIQLKLTPQN
jgi:DNA-binding NarL/FixJ family response regulator